MYVISIYSHASTCTERVSKYLSQYYGVTSSANFKNALENGYDEQGRLTDSGKLKIRDIFT